jgi:protein-S-isoprenylcysteine O-methyltransferase Ste14
MNDRVKILLMMVFYLPIVLVIFAALLFIPADDFTWLEGWIFIIIFFTYIVIYFLYSLIKDPEILMKRGKYTTDDPETTFLPDKTFMILAVVVFGFIFIFPAFDHALNISPLPWYIEILGFFGLIISLIGITYINKVNRYASKGLVIHKDHELITSGPYQYIRHPMYSIFIIFTCSMPVALGSFIAFLVSLLFPILLIYRIQIEEKMLIDHLTGYKDYMERVKYRLIPKLY